MKITKYRGFFFCYSLVWCSLCCSQTPILPTFFFVSRTATISSMHFAVSQCVSSFLPQPFAYSFLLGCYSDFFLLVGCIHFSNAAHWCWWMPIIACILAEARGLETTLFVSVFYEHHRHTKKRESKLNWKIHKIKQWMGKERKCCHCTSHLFFCVVVHLKIDICNWGIIYIA